MPRLALPGENVRNSPLEQARAADLLRLLPRNRRTVLDVGARDGFFSALLCEYFEEVTALDLRLPQFHIERVRNVQGDVTCLEFPADSFDVVFCAEVLEHVPQVEKACREIVRIARNEVLIGVPFQQDTRLDRTTCQMCGRASPPWGHVNSFDESGLHRLFAPLELIATSFVGCYADRTNKLAAALMDYGGNPWGSYDQEEPCMHCGAKLVAPARRSFVRRGSSALAERMNRIQRRFSAPRAHWIHLLYRKPRGILPG
jgi:SAM-dependent methyltransferase